MPKGFVTLVQILIFMLLTVAIGLLTQVTFAQSAGEEAAFEAGRATREAASTPEESSEGKKVTDEGSNARPPGASPDFLKPSKESLSRTDAIKSLTLIKALSKFLDRLQPNQGGIIWLFVIVMVLVAFDYQNLVSWRNADLTLLIILSFFFIDIVSLGGGWSPSIKDAGQKSLFGFVFLGIFLVSIALLIRSLFRAFRAETKSWTPNLTKRALVVLAFILLACNTLLALIRFPDDCGNYINLGTSRMLETGHFPYGDPKLRGGAAATYGPVLYIAHMPFQIALSSVSANPDPSKNPLSHWIVMGGKTWYYNAPVLATKLTLLAFHFLAAVGLFLIGRRMRDAEVGWGLVCLYAGSAYVQGLGGEEFFIMGMTYISHIAPAAVTIMAFAFLHRPFWAGALLAVAAGTLFYPAFFFPLWLGYYMWQKGKWQNFAVGFVTVCTLILVFTLLMTQSSENESVLRVIYESTVGHQEAKDAYGSSTFSFWGTHPKYAAFWQKPLIHGEYLMKPSFLLFTLFITGTFFMARGRTVTQFAFLTAAIAIAVQLWKSHAGGTYVEWYYPFFLIGLLAWGDTNHDYKRIRAIEENCGE